MATEHIVIVGASLAGGTAAQELRERGFDGELTLIGAEPHEPYERPPLSKELLQGKQDEPDWVAEHWKDMELVTGVRATSVDADARRVLCADGSAYAYDRLVLATGAEPTLPSLAGADLPGVHTLRTWEDATALRSAALAAGHVVVLGASWIGCEVAASLRQQGVEVDIVDPGSLVLPGLASPEVSARVANLHRAHGVRLALGEAPLAIEGSGAVEAVKLRDRTIETTVVVSATGVTPDLTLARSARLREAENGVAVSSTFQTSDQHIYAVGDLAAVDHPLYGQHIRVEHWDVAQQHGKAVAAVLTGDSTPYSRPPMFYSDQYDLGFEYRGYARPGAEVVLRDEDASWWAYWVEDGRVTAVLNANAWDDGDRLWEIAAQQPPLTEVLP